MCFADSALCIICVFMCVCVCVMTVIPYDRMITPISPQLQETLFFPLHCSPSFQPSKELCDYTYVKFCFPVGSVSLVHFIFLLSLILTLPTPLRTPALFSKVHHWINICVEKKKQACSYQSEYPNGLHGLNLHPPLKRCLTLNSCAPLIFCVHLTQFLCFCTH